MAHERNPYTQLSRKVVYTNPWMTVVEDETEVDGKKGIYSIVQKNDGAAIIAFTKDHNILLVGQWRYPAESYSWELPMGGIEEGESLEDAGNRELMEEAGYKAERWEHLGSYHTANGHSSHKMQLAVAHGLEKATATQDEAHDIVVQEVTMETCEEMVKNGDIFDGPTLSALYLYLLHNKKV